MKSEKLEIRICLLLIGLFLFPILSFGQTFPQSSSGEILFYVDTASFLGDEGFVYQEIYYEIPGKQLRFVTTPQDKFMASVEITAMIISPAGDTLVTDDVVSEMYVQSVEESRQARTILQQSAFFLKPGDYQLAVAVRDIWGERTGDMHVPLRVDGFADSLIAASTPEMALNIVQVDSLEESVFSKGNLIVYPNASHRYGAARDTIHVYGEFYHGDPQTNSVLITYFLQTFEGKPIGETYDRVVKKHNEINPFVLSMPVRGFVSGSYHMIITLADGSQHVTHRLPIEITDFYESQLSAADLYRQSILLNYFGTRDDQKMFESLTVQGKNEFLIDFWQRLDPVPATATNEFLHEVAERIKRANTLFSGGHKAGWETDAGRIFIRFGPPNDIEKVENSENLLPHEIWTYYDKDRKFWFISEEPDYYRLIHNENEPGETDLPNWEKLLEVTKKF